MTHDLDWLEGAKVTKVERGEVGDAIWLTLAEPVLIAGHTTTSVCFEVWRDEEGNGPGYLALTRAEGS